MVALLTPCLCYSSILNAINESLLLLPRFFEIAFTWAEGLQKTYTIHTTLPRLWDYTGYADVVVATYESFFDSFIRSNFSFLMSFLKIDIYLWWLTSCRGNNGWSTAIKVIMAIYLGLLDDALWNVLQQADFTLDSSVSK